MPSVLITPRSFGKYDQRPYEMLKEHNIDIIENPNGGILNEAELTSLIRTADGLIVGVDPISEAVLSHAERLVSIAKYGVGVDNIDVNAAERQGISVSITKGANSEAVADYAFALLLGVARRLVEIDKGCRENDWTKKVSIDIWGKKIGILGLGAIGKGVAKRADGFNMEIYGFDIYKDDELIKENHIYFTDVPTILRECDFISLHLPLTEKTYHLINKDSLSTMKRNAILINTARGAIVDENDLYDALKKGTIYGAGIDVFEKEPAKDSKLLELDNVIVGSHCAASTEGAVDQMSMIAVQNIVADFRKKGIIHG